MVLLNQQFLRCRVLSVCVNLRSLLLVTLVFFFFFFFFCFVWKRVDFCTKADTCGLRTSTYVFSTTKSASFSSEWEKRQRVMFFEFLEYWHWRKLIIILKSDRHLCRCCTTVTRSIQSNTMAEYFQIHISLYREWFASHSRNWFHRINCAQSSTYNPRAMHTYVRTIHTTHTRTGKTRHR